MKEVRERQIYDIAYTWNLKNYAKINIQNRNRHKGIGKKHVLPKGKG